MQPTSPRARLRPFRLLVLLLAAALGAAVLALVPRGADAQAPGLPPVGTNFAAAGPYQVTVQTDSAHTYYSPATLGQNGVKHPIILWGNGTGTTPPIYDGLLRHFASHGFVVAAANTSNAGSGNEMLAGLDNLTTFNGQSWQPLRRPPRPRACGRHRALPGRRRGHRLRPGPAGRHDLPAAGLRGADPYRGPDRHLLRRPERHDPHADGRAVELHRIEAPYPPPTPSWPAPPTSCRSATPAASGGPATAWARWQLAGDGNGRGLSWGRDAGCAPRRSGAPTRPTPASRGSRPPATTTTSTTAPSTTSTTAPSTTTTVVPPGDCVVALNSAHIRPAGPAGRSSWSGPSGPTTSSGSRSSRPRCARPLPAHGSGSRLSALTESGRAPEVRVGARPGLPTRICAPSGLPETRTRSSLGRVIDEYTMLVGGDRVAGGGGTYDGRQPRHRGGGRPGARGVRRAGRGRGRRRRPRRSPPGAGPRPPSGRRCWTGSPTCWPPGRPTSCRSCRPRPAPPCASPAPCRSPRRSTGSAATPGAPPSRPPAAAAHRDALDGARARRAAGHGRGAPAGGRRGLHHALQLPACQHGGQGRAGPGHGQHGRRQAGAPGPAGRAAPSPTRWSRPGSRRASSTS